MTRSRAIDDDRDWLFGKGRNDYFQNLSAVAQDINTRLNEFSGDCFFNAGAGIDWFNLLGAKDQLALKLSISAVILNTPNVTQIQQLSFDIDPDTRALTVRYAVNTVYGPAANQFQFNGNPIF